MGAISGDGAVLDLCVYPDGAEPDRRLGRLWAQWEIPDEQRVALARRIKTIGHMANFASNITDFEARIEALLTSLGMWPSGADRIYLNMNW